MVISFFLFVLRAASTPFNHLLSFQTNQRNLVPHVFCFILPLSPSPCQWRPRHEYGTLPPYHFLSALKNISRAFTAPPRTVQKGSSSMLFPSVLFLTCFLLHHFTTRLTCEKMLPHTIYTTPIKYTHRHILPTSFSIVLRIRPRSLSPPCLLGPLPSQILPLLPHSHLLTCWSPVALPAFLPAPGGWEREKRKEEKQ